MNANLEEATFNEKTIWQKDFKPENKGIKKVNEEYVPTFTKEELIDSMKKHINLKQGVLILKEQD